MQRINVLKTYKIFINGQFPRTESGRYYELRDKRGTVIANLCQSSKKDFRNAVVAARTAFPGWSGRAAFNRSQILYRVAEMLEGRHAQFTEELIAQGLTKKKAVEEVSKSVDRLIYYSGWCDKYASVFSSVNPVSGPFHNFSVPGPSGVVSLIAPGDKGLLGLVSTLAPVLAGGNTCVVLAGWNQALAAVTFAEVLATSDLPAGVVNLLTGSEEELLTHFSSHMDVNAIVYCGENATSKKIAMENCATNVKRFVEWNRDWTKAESADPYLIMDLQEIKTSWMPVDDHGSGQNRY